MRGSCRSRSGSACATWKSSAWRASQKTWSIESTDSRSKLRLLRLNAGHSLARVGLGGRVGGVGLLRRDNCRLDRLVFVAALAGLAAHVARPRRRLELDPRPLEQLPPLPRLEQQHVLPRG